MAFATMFSPAIQRAEEVFNILLASTYLTAAAAVVLLYDHLLTLPDEVAYVWSSPFSFATLMFYIIYLPFTDNNRIYCQVALLIQPIGEALVYIAASWILMLRVMALFRRNRSFTVALYVVFAITHIVALALVVRVLIRVWPSLQYSPVFKVCVSNGSIRDFSTVYFALLPFEILLIALQIYHLTGHRHVLNMSGATGPSILRTIYLDGSIYFVIVFCLRIWAGSIYAFADVSLFYTATWTEFAFGATTVSRLFLRLRRNARLVEGDSGAALSTLHPFSVGFGTAATDSLPSPADMRRGRGRASTLSTVLSVESFWTKDVIDIRNENDSGSIVVGVGPDTPPPRPPSKLLLFVKARRPSRVRSATF